MLSNALKALKANRLKTLLIYLTLLFSITAIFLITSISHGIISMYSSMLKNDADIIITQAKISDTFFSNVDISLIDKINKINGVTKTSAMIVGASPIEDIPIAAIYGITKNRFSTYKLINGTYPKLGEVILGNNIYNALANKQNIKIANKQFKISGIFKSNIGFENGGAIVNIQDASQIFNKQASMIFVNINLLNDKNNIIKQILTLDNNIDAKSTDSFVTNYNQFEIIRKSSFIISAIAFAMGLLSIASIMSITITQREDEFGIKKAIGIPTKNIILSITIEALIIGLFAFVSAWLISDAILILIKNIQSLHGYVNGEISQTLLIYVFVTSILMTIIGSIIPALQASKVDPIILIQGNKR